MRLGKYDLKAVWNKTVARHFSEVLQAAHEMRKAGKYIVIVRGDCNLRCYSCSMRPELPGSITTPDQLHNFLINKDPEKWVYFSGGEPTIDPDHLVSLVKVARDNGRRVALLTNGYKADGFNPFNFDFITLDDHKINKKRINEVIRFYDDLGYKKFKVLKNLGHFDIQAVLDSGYKSPGDKCGNYGKPALWGDKIYSCCGLPAVQRWISGTDKELCDRCWTGWRKRGLSNE